MSKLKSAATGAASGAAAGAPLGPWGMAGGAVLGGAIGYLTGSDGSGAPSYTPQRSNFDYGLGSSGGYAYQQGYKYDRRQEELAALGQEAWNREAPTQATPQTIDFEQSSGQQYLNNADRDARRQQLAALGGLDRSSQALGQFAQGGSNATQGAIQQAADMGARQQYGMARTQPGGGGAALRNAAFNAAGIMNNAGNTAAIASQQDRAQQLAALQAQQAGQGQVVGYTGQMRGQDQGFAQVQAGQANYDAGAQNQFRTQQQQLQYNIGQNNLNAQLQSRQQNDATTLAMQGQSQGYDALRNQLASGNAQAGYNYEAARAQGAGLGSTNYNNAQQQSNAETGMMLGALSSGAGAYAQMQGGGNKPTSDVRAKTDIKPASVSQAFGGGPVRGAPMSPEVLEALNGARDTNARSQLDFNQDEFRTPGAAARIGLGKAGDARQERIQSLLALGANDRYHAAQEGQQPSTWGTGDIIPDMRPAQGYEYAYKDPERHGEGRYVGPMAQDLEHLPGVVEQGADGTKSINAPRLTLANTAALSEQQRRDDEDRKRLERLERLTALGTIPASGSFSGYR